MSPVDEALKRFADGSATRADVQTIVDNAKTPLVRIELRRYKPPAHGKSIRLLGHSGPYSSEDRNVEHVSGPRHGAGPSRGYAGNPGGLWAAWWRVADLILWLRQTEHESAA